MTSAEEAPTPANSGAPAHDAAPATPPESAVAALHLPAGFTATLFAAEPDVQNPVAMAWDARGRLWVAENYTYAESSVRFDLRVRDRVLVFDDVDGDGRFDSRRVFIDSVQRLGSVAVGHGGVWLLCPPQLLFVPDRDNDAVPDGGPDVVLDGFTVADQNHHTFANGLRFGPDGWLYGRCGAASPGELGVPGTSANERVPLRGTMWRYHPTRKVVEALGSGTTNPWGHDWDEHGELFFINTVNGHLWHGITGAHYQRAHTIDPNPYVYQLIEHHADHWHFDTARTWQQSRDGAANSLGGGHAHVGMMIYQGDNWPAEYRGGLFTLNFHGRRANHERLERQGSGYVGRHGADLFVTDDPWFRGIDLAAGPDGGVFVLDWSDTGECHNSTGVNRRSGRIYKVTHGVPNPSRAKDLRQATDEELVALQLARNEWLGREARLQLATRAAAGSPLRAAAAQLRAMFAQQPEAAAKLRALWSLYGMGAIDAAFLKAQLHHEDEHVRTWAIRLLTDTWPLDTVLSRRPARAESADPELLAELVSVARTERSGLVRLALASTLQRLPPLQRLGLASALMGRREDAADHNLPLLIWYGLIPAAVVDPDGLARAAAACELPVTRRLVARRLAEEVETRPAALNTLITLATTLPAAAQADIVGGIVQTLEGWRRARKPAAWDAFAAAVADSTSAPASLRDHVRELGLVFGDGRALAAVKAVAVNPQADLAARKAALAALIDARPPDLRSICEALLRVRFLNAVAARGLASFEDPAIGELLARAFNSFHPTERGAAIEAMVSRPAFARVLLAHVAAGRIPRAAVTPFHARQIRGLNDPALTQLLTEAWGEVREASADKRAVIRQLQAELATTARTTGNPRAGRHIFTATCAPCHTLFGEGGTLGPDLTGAARHDLDYLIEHIVDPGALVTADYRISRVTLKDGRTLNGFISARTARTVTLRSMTDTHTIERDEIVGIDESPQSVMPDGLLDALTPDQRRDLFAYLMQPTPLPPP